MSEILINVLQNIKYTRPRSKNENMALLNSIISEDYEILSNEKNIDSNKLAIELNGKPFSLFAHLGRIHDNGFPLDSRPEIKRIQVRPIKDNMITSSDKCFLLCGVCYYLDEPILVVWLPFDFIDFESNRSAYVNVLSIKNAYENGFYYGADCGTNVYICKKGFFKELLAKYINDTKSEDNLCQF